jgi:uncharacterized protein YcnI
MRNPMKPFSLPRLAALMAAPLAAGLAAPPAPAHVTLERTQAPADSYYKAVLQVSHGCKGLPTLAVRVRIPEGVLSVKPQPKPGWTLTITRVKLAQPVDVGHGRTVTERPGEIAWTGGSLADEHFDEFRMVMKLPDRPGSTVYLPVVQECKDGVHRWIETPDAGKPAADLKEPAPTIVLTPKP